MSSNQYHFITKWEFNAQIEEVFKLIENGADLPRWWPDVYLAARAEKSGRLDRIGDKIHFHTKGWLPYTLSWTAEVTSFRPPNHMEIKAIGDFVGKGIWSLSQEGNLTKVQFDWHILAEKPLLRYFSFIAKPIFSWNHHWAMARGYESLRAELSKQKL
ncbi:MAG: polyketide cyclase [Acidobacteria bacterium]|nr:polyketide cyclase [Acidobacteriota bacterium]